MSRVSSSCGSAWKSAHDHETGSMPSPWISNVHWSSGTCGVGPADSTGKSRVSYWPGGMRSGGPSWRRPWNPREITPTSARRQPGHGRRDAVDLGRRAQAAVVSDRPAEHPLGVRVDRVQEPAVGRERLVSDALLAEARRRGDRIEQLEAPVRADAVTRDRPVAEVGHEGVAAVTRDDRPADLAARI